MQSKMQNRLLLATNNPGKVKELREMLAGLPGIELVTPGEIGLNLEVAETGGSYAENAELKAAALAKASGLVTLADDSGLEVDALDGEPGIRSARYAPQAGATDADRRAYLLANLAGQPRPWTARFRAVIAVVVPEEAARLRAVIAVMAPGETARFAEGGVRRGDHPGGAGERRVRLRPDLLFAGTGANDGGIGRG